ncbi:prepilin-type N-terminal cleavage/methylation domain-containing protein [Candidatus Gracilibacteria bacterium]|nr:prepilin-type N-terminal cleavage/methylation domain-containing protein [Candidatus Gracilibacteria bacterium]
MRFSLRKHASQKPGFSMIEVLLATSLLAIIVLGLTGSLMFGQESSRLSGERARAVFLAEETLEAVRNIRDDDFTNLVDGTYGLQVIGNQWEFSGTNDQIDGMFTRTVTISTIDQYRKEVTATVSWQQTLQRAGTVALQMYLTDWQRVVSVAPSFVIDATNAYLSNGNRQLRGITLENTGTSDLTIDTIQVSWTTSPLIEEINIGGTRVWRYNGEGSPYGRQASERVLDIENFTLPQNSGAIDIDSFEFNGNVSDSLFYIVFTLTDASEYSVTIDFTPGGGGGGGTNPPPEWTFPNTSGIYNTPSTASGTDVFVLGNTAYLTTSGRGPDLYAIDVSTLTAPTILSALELDGGANALTASGNTLFVSSTRNNQELQTININSTPTLIGSYDKPGNSNAASIAVSGSIALLGTYNTGGNPGYELYIFDVSDPTNPILLGGLDIGYKVNDIGISGNYAFLALENTSQEIIVIDISNPSSPSLITSVNLPNNSNGTALFVDGNYLYAGKESTSQRGEFYILDISNPAAPVIMNPNGFELGSMVTDIFVENGKAFITIENTTNGLQILDVSVPSVPSLIGTTSFAGIPSSVFVQNNVAFVATANRNQELLIVESQ